MLRGDQLVVQYYLRERGWSLEIASEGTLTPWQEGEWIELPLHGIWCKNPEHRPDFVEFMLNEADESGFLYRRDTSISMPLEKVLIHIEAGIPILAPEIVLLYKADEYATTKARADFRQTAPSLEPARRVWLRNALAKRHASHPWLEQLADK